MRLKLALLLFALAAFAWGKIAVERLSGGVRPPLSVGDLLPRLEGQDLPQSWGWFAETLRATGALEAGAVALALALGLLILEATDGRR
jgi:hypothetical protein